MDAIAVGGSGALAQSIGKAVKGVGTDVAFELLASGSGEVGGGQTSIAFRVLRDEAGNAMYDAAGNVLMSTVGEVTITASASTVFTAGISGPVSAGIISQVVSQAKPVLPDRTLVSQNGITIEHYYRSTDHGPAHAHVKGGGPETRIGPNGHPIQNDPPMTKAQQKVYDSNKSQIRRKINKIGKWLSRLK